MKFYYQSVAVDVIVGCVAHMSPPSRAELMHDHFLLKVLPESRLSVNGVRTVCHIRHLLKRGSSLYRCFVYTLCAIKRWAMQRGVYGNLFTFPNGVSLAILVAFVCLRHSVRLPSEAVVRFFSVYTQWLGDGAHASPIYLTDSLDTGDKPYIPRMPHSWRELPRTSSTHSQANHQHSDHDEDVLRCPEELMPVINPAYPYVNACHSVGRSGYTHFYHELLRVQQHLTRDGRDKTVTCDGLLPLLWTPYRLSCDYAQVLYVHVRCEVVGGTAHAAMQALRLWKGYVESKLRFLIYALEGEMDVRPCTTPVPATNTTPSPQRHVCEMGYVLGVRRCGVNHGRKDCCEKDATRLRNERLSEADFESPFEQFLFAVRDGCAVVSGKASGDGATAAWTRVSETGGGVEFVRDVETMADPWFTLHVIADTALPEFVSQDAESPAPTSS